MRVQGSYTYIDANGEPYEVIYVADENGYRVQSHTQKDSKQQDYELPEPVVVALPPAALASLVG